jgi:D-alanyl-D-alanine carboxypeptidase/D-alanyl-D-alanine-endopeptidase (penicillin-binding protein 4)
MMCIRVWVVLGLGAIFFSCASRKTTGVNPSTNPSLRERQLEDSLGGGHLGIWIQEAETGKIIAQYNGHKYFVPASNTKLLSLYAGLKYLPDSLPGIRYYEKNDTIYAQATGDPTLLMDEYKNHPVMDWLKIQNKPLVMDALNWKAERYGRGWTWSDYQASYQPERSALPVYGNIMPVEFRSWYDNHPYEKDSMVLYYKISMGPVGEGGRKLMPDGWAASPSLDKRFRINRDYASNVFAVSYPKKDTIITSSIPFVTKGIHVAVEILKKVPYQEKDSLRIYASSAMHSSFTKPNVQFETIKSQKTDSMLRPMMYRSDNFYAEQTLLMASNEFLGYMSDRQMIDTMMKTDFKEMPDQPVWADGSGLSRYNLQSPANYVWLLNKMRKEYPMQRLQAILPTGNVGTLTNYYRQLNGKIFAKTGTLSGVVALSGYLYAKSGKLLLFSTLVNNHNTEAPRVRRLIEQYLMQVWERN